MRVVIAAGSPARIAELVIEAGFTPVDNGPADVVVCSPEALTAAAARGASIVLVADELTADVAIHAHRHGARVCLTVHGPAPLRHAILHAAREGAMRASERVRALVNTSVADVVFYLAVEGDQFRFVEINPMFTRATGLAEEAVVGKLVDDVIPEPSLSLVLSKYREAVAERHTVRWDEVTRYPTGNKFGEVSVTPVVDTAGRCTHLLGTVHDVTEERQRDETIRLYADLVRSVEIGLTIWEAADLTLVAWNPEAERATSVKLAAGRRLDEIFAGAGDLVELVRAVGRDRLTRELSDVTLRGRIYSLKAFPVSSGGVGVAFEDVTTQARARALAAAEQRVLEKVASGATIEDTLAELVLAIEEQSPPSIASVLLLSPDGKRVLRGAAPHLPETYNAAIDGAPISAVAGSCGTSAFLRRPIIVSDIETDPLWDGYRELARAHRLRACWSTPIMTAEGRVIGTFALYYREPRWPAPEELDLIARATHVAGIAIQRHELDVQLRGLTARIEDAREEERTGIAREIHDQLGQTITALKIELAWIGRRVGAPAGLARDALLAKIQSLSAMTDEIIDQVRRISSELRPGILDDIGLVAALSWQAQQFEERTHITSVFHSEVGEVPMSREVSTTVFRVAQEALTNVVRHADATRVDLNLAANDSDLVLEIKDNGSGIRSEDIHHPLSLGLLGISERARRLGGTATFARGEPGGTVVTLRLPLAS